MVFLSIITPTYNRRGLVIQTIDSALQFAELATCGVEIIVVDDASTDATSNLLEDRYRQQLISGEVKLILNERNLGATGSKNVGACHAQGEWLLFLDSDDLIIPEITHDMLKILQRHDRYCIIFFRSEELETGQLIGPHHECPYELSLKDFLNIGTPGECLPVVRSADFAQFLYYPELRGCEGLTYAHMIKKLGTARVETLVARKYRTENRDRLSIGRGLTSRACYIKKYLCFLLADFHKNLGIGTIARMTVKLIYYWVHCLIIRLTKDKRYTKCFMY